jgi:DNA-binding transcriptional ArsR family regulator
MARGNLFGDVELDARGMRALAHPSRLAILRRLQTHGADRHWAVKAVGISLSVASWHLRHLAEHGLVKDAARQGPGRQRWWEAVNGFRFAVVDDDSADAARALTGVLEQIDGDLPGRWRAEVEPHLEPV